MTRTVIRGATIVTVDATNSVLRNGDLAIRDGRIAEIGHALGSEPGDAVLDASGMIAVPGLVNAHTHLWQTALRGTGGDWAGTDYYDNVHVRLGPAFEPEDSFASERLGALNQIASGTTAVFDWCHNNRSGAHSDASLEGLRAAGIRAVFGHGTVKAATAPGAPHYSTVPHPRSEIVRLAESIAFDPLIELSMCILGPDYSTEDVVRADLRLAQELGLRSSAHVWGKANRLVGDGYLPFIAEGLVDARHNVAHGNYFADVELAALLESGASLTSTSAGEVQGTDREPLVRRIRRLGGRPSLGNDSELGGTGDMFEIARRALAIHRFVDNLEIAQGGTAENRFLGAVGHDGGALQETYQATTADALRWATIDGARALGLENEIGSLEPGKQADIVLLDSRHPSLAPAHDPVDAVISQGSAASVDTVLISGVVRKRDGRMLDEMGLRIAVDEAVAAGERIMVRAARSRR